MLKNTCLDKILKSYENNFNIEKIDNDDEIFAAKAFFHSRGEKYILVKKAKIWAMETNEYVYFSTKEISTIEELSEIVQTAYVEGMKEIKPHSEHMCSTISLIIINESISSELVKDIKKIKKHKSFKFSFHGWMDLKVVAVDLSQNQIYTNAKANDMKKMYAQILKC